MGLMKALTSQYMKPELPEMRVGDTDRVHQKITEGTRERIQVFEGTIIARKHGGIGETITVRRISYGVGCEKVFPVHGPRVVKVETVRTARFAGLSCTTCAIASARLPRSKRKCKLSSSQWARRSCGAPFSNPGRKKADYPFSDLSLSCII